MLAIEIDKRVGLIAIGRWRFVVAVFANIEVGLFAESETGLARHFAVAEIVDVVAVGFGGGEARVLGK